MLTHRLTIENHDYVLDESTDVNALQIQICGAMRRGGGIVSFETSNHRPLTAILSPGIPVLFESIALPDNEVADDAENYLSVESYLEGF